MAGYQKNTWEIYDYAVPANKQPNAYITKDKLDRIEHGIENAVTDFKIGKVSKGTEPSCELVSDEYDSSIKTINMVIPREARWIYSEVELYDNSVVPTGVTPNDLILDSVGNVYNVIKNENDVYLLHKRLNIKGERGDAGEAGPEGKSGTDGKNGIDGNKWKCLNKRMYDGDESPDDTNVGDYIVDNACDVFEVLDDFTVTKVFNIRGLQGPEGPIGPAGKSTYDIWRSLGNKGDASEFLKTLKGEPGSNNKPVDSLESTSTTEPLSANQGRILKNNRLTTLDEILTNEEEGIFVDALAVKEIYLKLYSQMQEIMKKLS